MTTQKSRRHAAWPDPDEMERRRAKPLTRSDRMFVTSLSIFPAVAIAALVIFLIAQCEKGSPTVRRVERIYPSLDACLEGVPQLSGHPIYDITRDRPDSVRGRFTSGDAWGCDKEETGTLGVIWQGYAMVPVAENR